MLKKKSSGMPSKLSKSINAVIGELEAGRIIKGEAVEWIQELVEEAKKGNYTIYGSTDGSVPTKTVKGRRF